MISSGLLQVPPTLVEVGDVAGLVRAPRPSRMGRYRGGPVAEVPDILHRAGLCDHRESGHGGDRLDGLRPVCQPHEAVEPGEAEAEGARRSPGTVAAATA